MKTLNILMLMAGALMLCGCESDEEMAPRRRALASPIEHNTADSEVRGSGVVGAPIIVGEFGGNHDEPLRVRTPFGEMQEKPKAPATQPASQPAENALPASSPRGFSDSSR